MSDFNPMEIKPGLVVRHFKREINNVGNNYLYMILGIGTHTETQDRYVVYTKLDTAFEVNKPIYLRPYKMFMSKVDKEKYPNIKQEYRFEKHDFNKEINNSNDVEDFR